MSSLFIQAIYIKYNLYYVITQVFLLCTACLLRVHVLFTKEGFSNGKDSFIIGLGLNEVLKRDVSLYFPLFTTLVRPNLFLVLS